MLHSFSKKNSVLRSLWNNGPVFLLYIVQINDLHPRFSLIGKTYPAFDPLNNRF